MFFDGTLEIEWFTKIWFETNIRKRTVSCETDEIQPICILMISRAIQDLMRKHIEILVIRTDPMFHLMKASSNRADFSGVTLRKNVVALRVSRAAMRQFISLTLGLIEEKT
jgi:hypothetical protein